MSMSSLHPPARERTSPQVYATRCSFPTRRELSRQSRRLRYFYVKREGNPQRSRLPLGPPTRGRRLVRRSGSGVDPVRRQPLHRAEEGGILPNDEFSPPRAPRWKGPIIAPDDRSGPEFAG
jgi:hypothetical protein